MVTTGEALRLQLINALGLKASHVVSVPTGIDLQRFTKTKKIDLGIPAGAFVFGIVATLRSWKGHRHLLDALSQMAHRDARLAIVGDGPQRAALETQTDRLGLRERVTFAGQQNDVAPWLAALDVFALPSYANEGVPQALLQAMFAGVPCITTGAGAIPEIARDGATARVVAAEDPAALAAGLDALLDDRASALRFAAAAQAFVTPRYGLDTMLDRMDRVFRRAIDERGVSLR